MTEIRHVIPSTDGGWIVVSDSNGSPAANGNGNGAGTFDRRRDAEAYARDLLREHGGGEVILHTPAGSIVERSAVSPEEPVAAS
jgi:Uncharacterized protein conserved in bacteria (DUF2188)